jgi:hypothetical protein
MNICDQINIVMSVEISNMIENEALLLQDIVHDQEKK